MHQGNEDFNCLFISAALTPAQLKNGHRLFAMKTTPETDPASARPLIKTNSDLTRSSLLLRDRLIIELRPVMKMLQCFGLLPLTIHTSRIPTVGSFLLCILPICFICLNTGLFGFNVYVTHNIRNDSNGTLLTVDCISSIITGLKPCHNALNLLIFLLLRQRHVDVLEMLNEVDKRFRNSYGRSPIVKWHCFTLFILTITITAVAFGVRLTQYVWVGEKPGNNYLSDLSLIFVCFLSTWQVLPLFYFEFLNRVVRYWFRALREELQRDEGLQERRMKAYYDQYLLLTRLVARMGRFFNPFLFASMCVSVLVLCLTIYFLSEAQSIVAFKPGSKYIERVLVYFLIVWSVMQIAVAVLFVVAICVTGTLTNEEARKLGPVILREVPSDEMDRHYALWFLYLSQRQQGWGLSIWKAFPLERPLLFTLLSVMGTYAALLLKLKNDNGPRRPDT